MATKRQELLQPARIAHLGQAFRKLPFASTYNGVDYSPAGGQARLQRQISKAELEKYEGKEWRIRIIK